MNYGLPYMGSKNRIAEWVISYFPKKDYLYDLFCGGCAITHCAMTKNLFKEYHINDVNEFMPKAFIDALNGAYKNENRWIDKKEFNSNKCKGDFYLDACFSFGNKYGSSYAYNDEKEPYKKALHYAVFFGDYRLLNELGIHLNESSCSSVRDRYLYIKNQFKGDSGRLQSFESLNRLNSLCKDVNKVVPICTNLSYTDIEIKPNSLIYCDPPYIGKGTYKFSDFDGESFYFWCENQTEQVIISEYWMPEDRFTAIAIKEKRCTFSQQGNKNKAIEKLFVPNTQLEMYVDSMRQRDSRLF